MNNDLASRIDLEPCENCDGTGKYKGKYECYPCRGTGRKACVQGSFIYYPTLDKMQPVGIAYVGMLTPFTNTRGNVAYGQVQFFYHKNETNDTGLKGSIALNDIWMQVKNAATEKEVRYCLWRSVFFTKECPECKSRMVFEQIGVGGQWRCTGLVDPNNVQLSLQACTHTEEV